MSDKRCSRCLCVRLVGAAGNYCQACEIAMRNPAPPAVEMRDPLAEAMACAAEERGLSRGGHVDIA